MSYGKLVINKYSLTVGVIIQLVFEIRVSLFSTMAVNMYV